MIGDAPSEVISFGSSALLRRKLSAVHAKNPAFLALNDDTLDRVLPAELAKIDGVMSEFLTKQWPDKVMS